MFAIKRLMASNSTNNGVVYCSYPNIGRVLILTKTIVAFNMLEAEWLKFQQISRHSLLQQRRKMVRRLLLLYSTVETCVVWGYCPS